MNESPGIERVARPGHTPGLVLAQMTFVVSYLVGSLWILTGGIGDMELFLLSLLLVWPVTLFVLVCLAIMLTYAASIVLQSHRSDSRPRPADQGRRPLTSARTWAALEQLYG